MTGRLTRAVAAVGLLAAGFTASAPAAAAAAAPAAAGAETGERPAPRWHDGACAPDDTVGVTIIVDFQDLGGGVNVRCTERAPTDGADALDAAGIAWQGVVRWGRGFVCKIAGQPADDPCIDTPPASAYWGYWLAPRGGRWCYANKGVLNRTPPPGSVEGWSFSKDRDGGQSPPPRSAPPAVAPGQTPNLLPPGDCDPLGGTVPTTPPSTTPPPTPPPAGPGGGGAAVPLPGDPSAPGGPGGDSAASIPGEPGGASTTAPDGTTTTSATTTAPSGSTTDPRAAADEAAMTRPRGGDDEAATASLNPTDLSRDGTDAEAFPVSTVAGAGVVGALAVGGALLARRRRRAGGPDGDPLDDVLPG